MICDVCGKEVPTMKRGCDGDGGMHWHGKVHTMLRGNGTNDLANVGVECGCAERDHAAWGARRGRVGERK